MRYSFVLFLSIIFIAMSCEDKDVKLAKELKTQVEDHHDSLMLKLSVLRKKKKELIKAQGKYANTNQRRQIRVVLGLFGTAETFMFDWMNDMYKEPEEGTAVKEVIDYYEEQQVILNKMEADMDSCISEANKWIELLVKNE